MCFCNASIKTPNCGTIRCQEIEYMASDLRHLSVKQLLERKKHTETKIGNLQGRINNENTRLVWINKYLQHKTPVKMTLEQIEQELGYPVSVFDD